MHMKQVCMMRFMRKYTYTGRSQEVSRGKTWTLTVNGNHSSHLSGGYGRFTGEFNVIKCYFASGFCYFFFLESFPVLWGTWREVCHETRYKFSFFLERFEHIYCSSWDLYHSQEEEMNELYILFEAQVQVQTHKSMGGRLSHFVLIVSLVYLCGSVDDQLWSWRKQGFLLGGLRNYVGNRIRVDFRPTRTSCVTIIIIMGEICCLK